MRFHSARSPAVMPSMNVCLCLIPNQRAGTHHSPHDPPLSGCTSSPRRSRNPGCGGCESVGEAFAQPCHQHTPMVATLAVWRRCSPKQRLSARSASTPSARRCRPMPASSSTHARAAWRSYRRYRATAACFARTAITSARQSRPSWRCALYRSLASSARRSRYLPVVRSVPPVFQT